MYLECCKCECEFFSKTNFERFCSDCKKIYYKKQPKKALKTMLSYGMNSKTKFSKCVDCGGKCGFMRERCGVCSRKRVVFTITDRSKGAALKEVLKED